MSNHLTCLTIFNIYTREEKNVYFFLFIKFIVMQPDFRLDG